jgi:hypothetical protein
LDQGIRIDSESIIENLTNSSEVVGSANPNHIVRRVDKRGKVKGVAPEIVCEHCGKPNHKKDKCFHRHSEKAPEWWQLKEKANPSLPNMYNQLYNQSGATPGTKTNKVSLKDQMVTLRNQPDQSLEAVKEAVMAATEL